MGRVIPIGDSKALATAVLDILAEKKRKIMPRERLQEIYDPDSIAREYEALFKKIAGEIKSA
jgi:glycosyltransferase involved in cell wall biosynthesis